MSSSLKSWLAALAALTFASGAHAQTPAPPAPNYAVPGKLVALPDGRHINLYCIGDGGPTVVLDAGLGLGADVFGLLQPKLAETWRTCAFDRPGYRFSDPGPMPRDARHNAADLKAMLGAAGIASPYILVGHSRAGFDVRMFAQLYPHDVEGLVLLDPSLDDDAAARVFPWYVAMMPENDKGAMTCIRAAAAGHMKAGEPAFAACGSPAPTSPAASAAMAQAVLSELEAIPHDMAAMVTAPGGLGGAPMVVLSADSHFAPMKGVDQAQVEAVGKITLDGHKAIAATSLRGSQRTVAKSGHLIQRDQPDAVVEAVAQVVREASRADH